MDAVDFFKSQQPLLLWLANKSKEGRKLLRLDQTNLDRIDAIGHNFVTQTEYVRDGGSFFKPLYRRVNTTDFRVGAKWANLINYQWDNFCELAREYYAMMEQKHAMHVGMWNPVAMFPQYQAGTTTTVYPDPDPETTTVDGYIRRQAGAIWATIRDNADGSDAGPASGASRLGAHLISSATTDQWTEIGRSAFLFDTSGIADTDTISSGTFKVRGGDTNNDNFSQSVCLVSSSPASNTDLTTADYDQFGTTELSTGAIAIGSWNTGGFNTFTLAAGGLSNVSKVGVSKFGCRLSGDRSNTEPTWSGSVTANVHMEFSEWNASTANDPTLTIVHAASGPSASRRSIIVI